jgi:hypothetical protein
MFFRLAGFTVILLACATAVRAQQEESLKRYGVFKGADAVVVAKLDKVTPGGILFSNPPAYLGQMQLTPAQVIKGPLKQQVAFDAFYCARQRDAPTYPEGKTCLVALFFDAPSKTWTVYLIEEATAANVKEAKNAQ